MEPKRPRFGWDWMEGVLRCIAGKRSVFLDFCSTLRQGKVEKKINNKNL